MPTVAPLDIEGHVVSTHFLGDIPLFATAAGTIHRLDGGEKVTEAHDGLLTCVRDSYSATLLSGGEQALEGGADLAVASPGLKADGPWIRGLRNRGVPVIAEIELGWLCRGSARVLAVTGSNGKSTLVKLCAEALAAGGRRASRS